MNIPHKYANVSAYFFYRSEKLLPITNKSILGSGNFGVTKFEDAYMSREQLLTFLEVSKMILKM